MTKDGKNVYGKKFLLYSIVNCKLQKSRYDYNDIEYLLLYKKNAIRWKFSLVHADFNPSGKLHADTCTPLSRVSQKSSSYSFSISEKCSDATLLPDGASIATTCAAVPKMLKISFLKNRTVYETQNFQSLDKIDSKIFVFITPQASHTITFRAFTVSASVELSQRKNWEKRDFFSSIERYFISHFYVCQRLHV